MPRVPETIIRESYLLKSTFFYNKLKSRGYFDLFCQIQKLAGLESPHLDLNNRTELNISEDAWNFIENNKISPMLVFAHPKVLKLHPTFLKYYRSVAMLPQKGLKAISHISNVERIESGLIDTTRITSDIAKKLSKAINEVISLIITLSSGINEQQIQGMMYATAGSNIEGSWRNQIGAEGERVIRSIIFKELYNLNEISHITKRDSKVFSISECDIDAIINDIDIIKDINLINGYSILFSSEPDITIFDNTGNIVGVIEIKSGLDPAGALERLGAMLKSFENTLAEYPEAITILVASCITEEVETRLGASMLVRQKYITTNITANNSEKRKFVNRLRAIMKLTSGTSNH